MEFVDCSLHIGFGNDQSSLVDWDSEQRGLVDDWGRILDSLVLFGMVPWDSDSLERVVCDPQILGIVWVQSFGVQCGSLEKHLYLKDQSLGEQLKTLPSSADPAQD